MKQDDAMAIGLSFLFTYFIFLDMYKVPPYLVFIQIAYVSMTVSMLVTKAVYRKK